MKFVYCSKSTWCKAKEITLITGEKCNLYNFWIYEHGPVELYWTKYDVYLNYNGQYALLGPGNGVWRVYPSKHWIIIDCPYFTTSDFNVKSNTVKIFTKSLTLVLSTKIPIDSTFRPLNMKILMLKMKLIKLIHY